MSCVFLIFLLSGPLYSCFACATVYAMPTRPVGAYADHIPLKVCLRRANARVKMMAQPTCLPTPSHSRQLLEIWAGTFAYATRVPSTFC